MREFVDMFKKDLEIGEAFTLSDLLGQIELALSNSEMLVGSKIQFDLESLMVVLQDLDANKDNPISAPTFAFMLHLITQKNKEIGTYNIENVRKTFGKRAKKLLDRLRKFIFKLCMKPIGIGQKNRGGFFFFDLLYGPLFILLGDRDIRSGRTRWVFTTNWDLCIKQWLEYASLEFEDGTNLDRQRKPVLSPSSGWIKGSDTRKIVPLHGSLDLIKKLRPVSGGFYEEIYKVTAPETYFKGNPSEIAKAFMIYPLEAVGYEQSVKSPYLDMLNLLKEVLRSEPVIFVIGFSFRDSTIASIFEEVLRERAERGDWQPVTKKSNLQEMEIKTLSEMRLKVVLIDSSPQRVINNLARLGYVNIERALIPIQVSFPDMMSDTYDPSKAKIRFQQVISHLYDKLHELGLISDIGGVNLALKPYGISIQNSHKG